MKEKTENKNNKTKIKKTGFSIRTTEDFLKALQYVADKREMSKTEVIEYLVRLERERLSGILSPKNISS